MTDFAKTRMPVQSPELAAVSLLLESALFNDRIPAS